MQRIVAMLVTVLTGFALAVPNHAQDDDPTEEPDIREESPAPPAVSAPAKASSKGILHVREWGVDTMAWDGSPEPKYDAEMLPYFYDINEIPISAPPEVPVAVPPKPKDTGERRARGAKPIIYFDCDRSLSLSLQVKYTSGRVTFMYPKPDRRTDVATAQWDKIALLADDAKVEKSPELPALAAAPADHWANYSREGSTSSLIVNGEQERYVFYEGNPFQPAEADVFKDAKGQYVLRNYGACELLDVRLALKTDSGIKAWYIKEIAAGSSFPTDVQLTEELAVKWEGKAGLLAASVEGDGLTTKQAAAFERAWSSDFFAAGGNVLSYRRSKEEIDGRCELKVTAPESIKTEFHRSGWVLIHDIDLARQAEIEGLVATAVDGDEDSAKKLPTLGLAGINAIRRAMSNSEERLVRRLAMARLLKRCTQG